MSAGPSGDLAVTIGQHSAAGRKPENQDFHGSLVPAQPALGLKGIAVALADGISSSAAGAAASETAVKSVLSDYYATPDTWSVKNAAQRVIAAADSWLYAQTRRGIDPTDADRGYVTTFDALILKARTAHLFHVGDGRIWRVSGRSLEQLTEDHRVVVSAAESYLGRALGVTGRAEIDYQSLAIAAGDIFVLTTDGVHEHVRPREIVAAILAADDLDAAARAIVAAALAAGSPDNLTIQIVRIEAVPEGEAADLLGDVDGLDSAPLLDPPAEFDGYRLLRILHSGPRSRVYLAVEMETGARVALKVLSLDLRDDPAQRKRFALEEWIARRIDNPHVLKAQPPARRRSHLYTVMRYVDGQSLTQWMRDHAAPELETVRGLVEQIARGVQALHRREMVHQDLRPDNVLIDMSGTVQVIDFGATKVAGVIEGDPRIDPAEILGTVQYTAPECFLGVPSTAASDVFSVGVIAYQMLTGRLPYGDAVPRARTPAAQRRLRYVSALHVRPLLPVWVDGALRQAVHPDPLKRYKTLSEFVHDLRYPNPAFTDSHRPALLERDPLLFWRLLSLVLGIIALTLAGLLIAHPPR
ncbi:bifunctional serine/threonine-protein phosphatase/kinase [Methylobacterium sp. J-030]|uniref:bifunctional protein-serine/threonine kinase/phosphatase n=1 Tax=Methylobacterium sp. J-030 TaxID=2836627 RepID=UPI001FBA8255|nr:bifunctional protein-serine/threonine kinase/phosphatase [Methylobacterium sp. J-030]MCJ2071629.1 bifunctional serine/threonine-protein phosphatase/kinase [Methylobacterium sp. J-030]